MDFLVDFVCVFSIGFTTLLSTGKIHTEKLINVCCVRLERRPEQKSTENSFGHLGGEKKTIWVVKKIHQKIHQGIWVVEKKSIWVVEKIPPEN